MASHLYEQRINKETIPLLLVAYRLRIRMALGSTQPLAEMSIRNLPEGKGRPARKTDNLTAICESII
jgi:hypothetical protein